MRIDYLLRLLLAWCLLLILPAHAFEFDRFDVVAQTGRANCIDQTCTISFADTYSEPPLVFLMDTVEFKNENDQPSSLVIINVTKNAVTFKQSIPSAHRKSNSGVIPTAMKLIDYFVIAKGVYNIDGATIVAGSINTKKYQYQLKTKSNATPKGWEYKGFTANTFPSGVTPGVLHQVQTRNNATSKNIDFWLTSTVKDVTRNGFRLALERSEIDGYKVKNSRDFPTESETIGYVAAYGQGEKDGVKFAMGSQQTLNTIGGDSPVTAGCETYANYGPFSTIPILIANKNSRSGNNGGWVRRCRIQTDKASFMVDEDMDTDTERGHVAERVGYFLFEKPFEVQQCEYFTGAAQTWSNDGEAKLDWTSVIKNTNTVNNRHIGFAQIDSPAEHNTSCVTGRCIADPSLMVKKPPFVNYIPSGPDVEFKANNNGSLAPGFYSKVTVKGNSRVSLTGGEYWIGELDITGSSQVAVLGPTKLNVVSLEISGAAILNHTGSPADLFIIAHTKGTKGTKKFGIDLAGSSSFNAFVFSEDEVKMRGTTRIYGAVTTYDLDMQGSPRIIGKLEGCETPNERKLVISPKTAFGLTCQRIPVDFEVQRKDGMIDTGFVGNLAVSPESNPNSDVCWSTSAAGACESSTQQVPINGGQVRLYLQSLKVGDIDVSAYVVENQSLADQAGPYRFSPYGFRINDSQPAYMVAGKTTNLKVEVVASNGAQCDVIKDYGKPQGEEKTLTFKELSYVRPRTKNYTIDIAGRELATGASRSEKISFKNGVANIPVNYRDAGEVHFSLEDPEWHPEDCPAGVKDCDNHQGDWQGLQGTAVIYSRPYTFALCDIRSGNNTDFSGTASDANSKGFAKAGNNFSVTVRPVSFPDFSHVIKDNSGDRVNDIITTSNSWCGDDWATPNYYQVNALDIDAPIALSIPNRPHTPENGSAGELAGTLTQQYTSSTLARNGITIGDLTWSEVGSVWLQARGRYLEQDIDQGVAAVGRFYPANFKLDSSAAMDANGNFTYMDQGFGTEFTVKAVNIQGKDTQNYGLFNPELKESLILVGIDSKADISKANNLTSRLDKALLDNGWENNWQGATLMQTSKNVGFKRVKTTNLPLTTKEDGPYDTKLGLAVVSRSSADCTLKGCTDFATRDLSVTEGDGVELYKAKQLEGTIHARYGRIALDDAAAEFDQFVRVPLRVEYWNGNDFVTNSNDDVSTYHGQRYCKVIISQDAGTSTSVLRNSDTQQPSVEHASSYTVEKGIGAYLFADPKRSNTDLYREQVQFWLRLSNQKPYDVATMACQSKPFVSQSWLLYNWRNKGDEDPSSVVTFGVYRGNDRIIYRGEKGMNQLLN